MSIVVSVTVIGMSVAFAALTFSGTTISGNSGVVIDSSSTISIGTSSAASITIGNNNATTSFFGNVGIGTSSPSAPLEIDTPSGNNGFFLLSSIGGVPRGGLTSKDTDGGGTELSFHANVSMNATGSPSSYLLYNTGEPGFAFDLLPRWDEASLYRFTGPNGNLTAQKVFAIDAGGLKVNIGTPMVTGNPSTPNFGGISPALILAEGGDATATTTYNSNPLQFQNSGWDTGASTFLDRMITLSAIAGSGATGKVPYRLSFKNDSSTEVFNIDALTGNVGVGQVTISNMYPGITVKSQGFRNVGLGLNTPSGITFQNRQNTGNTAGIGLSDDDSALVDYTWDGSVFQPRLSIIAASGNVGIGTQTPSTTLQLGGTLPTIRIGASSLAGCVEVGNSDGSAGINYVTFLNGAMTVTTTKPSVCQ